MNEKVNEQLAVEIGKRLLELREDAKISQIQLSKELGVSQNAIWRYESGTNYPPYDVLIGYGRFFNVSIDWILGRCMDRSGILYSGIPQNTKQKVDHYIGQVLDMDSPMMKELLQAIDEMIDRKLKEKEKKK